MSTVSTEHNIDHLEKQHAKLQNHLTHLANAIWPRSPGETAEHWWLRMYEKYELDWTTELIGEGLTFVQLNHLYDCLLETEIERQTRWEKFLKREGLIRDEQVA